MRQTRFWTLLIIFIFLVSLISTIGIYFINGVGSIASVYQNGKLIERIHLDTVTTPYEFTIDTSNGGFNTIQVEHGRICISDASCPDHVCVHTGWISDGVVPIVCLPNELIIQIEGENAENIDIAVQ